MKEKIISSLCLHWAYPRVLGSDVAAALEAIPSLVFLLQKLKKCVVNITEIKLFLSLFFFPVKPGIQYQVGSFSPTTFEMNPHVHFQCVA